MGRPAWVAFPRVAVPAVPSARCSGRRPRAGVHPGRQGGAPLRHPGSPTGVRARPASSTHGGPRGPGATLQDQDVTEAHAERGGAREEG